AQGRLDQLVALVLEHAVGAERGEGPVADRQLVQPADHLDVGQGQDVDVEVVVLARLLSRPDLQLHAISLPRVPPGTRSGRARGGTWDGIGMAAGDPARVRSWRGGAPPGASCGRCGAGR